MCLCISLSCTTVQKWMREGIPPFSLLLSSSLKKPFGKTTEPGYLPTAVAPGECTFMMAAATASAMSHRR